MRKIEVSWKDYKKSTKKPYLLKAISMAICFTMFFTSIPAYAYAAAAEDAKVANNLPEVIETSEAEKTVNNAITTEIVDEESTPSDMEYESESTLENAASDDVNKEIGKIFSAISGSEDYVPDLISCDEYYGKRFIRWSAVNYESDAVYQIHRGTSSSFTPTSSTMIADNVDASIEIYIDNEIISNGTYYYKILVNSSGSTYESNPLEYVNTVNGESFEKRTGFKDYFVYYEFGLPTGTGYIEKSSGNLIYSQDDYFLSNPQLEYGLSRTYNSQLNITTAFGKGWVDSYHKELYKYGTSILLLDSDGSITEFEKDGLSYVCKDDLDYELIENTNGYTVKKDDISYIFSKGGQLQSITEPNGCSITFKYNEDLILTSVVSQDGSDGEREISLTYDSTGKYISSITDLKGVKYDFSYGSGNLTQVEVSKGESKTVYKYGYNASTGYMNKMYDALNNCYEAVYTGEKAVTVTYPNGEKYTLSYDTENNETKVTKINENGAELYSEYCTYDSLTGRVLSIKDAYGITTAYTYGNTLDTKYLVVKESTKKYYQKLSSSIVTLNEEIEVTTDYTYSEGNLITESSSDGMTTNYSYNEDDKLVGEVILEDNIEKERYTYQYDNNGNLTVSTNVTENIVDTYTYGDWGNITNSVTVDKSVGDGVETERTVSSYDDYGNVISEETISGSMHSLVSSSYDAMGNTISSTETIYEASADSESAILEEEESVKGFVITDYTYDFLGRMTSSVLSTKENTAARTVSDKKEQYTEYNANGSVIREVSPSGAVTTYTYDNLNRNTSKTVSGEGIENTTITTEYGYAEDVTINDGLGERTESLLYLETTKDSAGNEITVTYTDFKGNLLKEKMGTSYTCYGYDNDGTCVAEYKGVEGLSTYQLDVSLFDRDDNNFANIESAAAVDGSYKAGSSSITTYSTYDDEGKVLTETDGRGIVTAYSYDSDDRVTACTVNGKGVTASYEENEDGTLTTVITDENGFKQAEVTDINGEIISTSDISGNLSKTTNYLYDTEGNNIKILYPDGSYIINEFDLLNQNIRSTSYKAGGAIEEVTAYVYDVNGNITEARIFESDGTTEKYRENFIYDAEGKLVSKTVTYDNSSESETISYSYDNEDRLIKTSYAGKSNLGDITYSYDSYGNIQKIYQNEKLVTEYIYDGFYRISKRYDYTSAGGSSYILRNYSYDSFDRVTAMTSRFVGASSKTFEGYYYTYDKGGNITSEEHSNTLLTGTDQIDETKEYSYDRYGRLIETVTIDHLDDDAEIIQTYEYDDVGNRLSVTTEEFSSKNRALLTDEPVIIADIDEEGENVEIEEYEYNGFNQLAQSNIRGQVTTYQYDEKGNQIKETTEDDVITYTYSVAGEMISAVRNGSLFEQKNEYNHEGVRISKTEDGVKRNYYYDNGSVAYTTDNGSVSSANILGSYQNVIGSYRGDDYYVYTKDILGSTSSITKEDGRAAAVYDYSDFGQVVFSYDVIDNEICYAGSIYDETTGLHYMNARYYNPETGRFISQDTYRANVDDPSLWHLYVYCANNPINYTDPSGHKSYDIKSKLDAEMKKNAKWMYDYALKQKEKYPTVIGFGKSKSLRIQSTKGTVNILTKFVSKVKTGGDWDLKGKKKWKPRTYGASNFKYDNYKFSAADVGNVHFGYVGAVIFNRTTLCMGAGMYQIYSGTSDFKYISSYFDDPRDTECIKIGYNLWKKNYGKRVYIW